MLTVGYSFADNYDQTFHVGAGRIRDYECVQEFVNVADKYNLCIQADGDELELIRNQFTGIPITTTRVVRWRGETAGFILDNLKL